MIENSHFHRYFSIKLINFIGYTKELLDFIFCKENYSFNTLLCSYDEEKPLILHSNTDYINTSTLDEYYNYTDFFTYLAINENSNVEELIAKIINYYTDHKNVKVLYEYDDKGVN